MTDEVRKQHFLACLSDPSRFSLIAMLSQGPQCVTELATRVGLSQSCTTRHLQALLREGIVSSHRQGKRVVFEVRVAGPDAHPVLNWAFGGFPAPVSAPRVGTSRSRHPGRAVAGIHHRAQAEVTDALIVAHDSVWENDDTAAPVGNGTSRSPTQEPGADFEPASDPAVDSNLDADSVRPARSQLDDFLL